MLPAPSLKTCAGRLLDVYRCLVMFNISSRVSLSVCFKWHEPRAPPPLKNGCAYKLPGWTAWLETNSSVWFLTWNCFKKKKHAQNHIHSVLPWCCYTWRPLQMGISVFYYFIFYWHFLHEGCVYRSSSCHFWCHADLSSFICVLE